ncbi:MAG: hypothetical protein ACREUU_08460 [Gammaproteobacteria bacterium]
MAQPRRSSVRWYGWAFKTALRSIFIGSLILLEPGINNKAYWLLAAGAAFPAVRAGSVTG